MNEEELEALEDKRREREEAQRLVGMVIGAKYRIDAYVGGGAMGKVYKAKQLLLDKVVAVKVLHTGIGSDEKFQGRFHREAKAASRLDHVNSVGVIDFGIEPSGMMFIVMEFLDGRDLYTALRKEWPFSNARIVDVMTQVLSALAVAHEHGIVHRDLKPENIMLVAKKGDDGELVDVVKVADFGIAKILESSRDGDGQRLTTQGMIAGTPEYMSPEQAQAREVDGRSDLYSCGVILYEMATGKLPFSSETAIGVVLQHVTTTPPPPRTINPNVDPQLEAIILKTLEKNPANRFSDAREMRNALRELMLNPAFATAHNEVGAIQDGRSSIENASTALGLPAVPSLVMRASGIPTPSTSTGQVARPAEVVAPDGPKESAGVERVSTHMGLPAPSSERVGTSGVTHELAVPPPAEKKGIAPATVGASLVAALAIGALVMNSLRTPANPQVNTNPTTNANTTTAASNSAQSGTPNVAHAVAQTTASNIAQVAPTNPEVAHASQDSGVNVASAEEPPVRQFRAMERTSGTNARVLGAPRVFGAMGNVNAGHAAEVLGNLPIPTTSPTTQPGTALTATVAQVQPPTNTQAVAPTNVPAPPVVAPLTRVVGSVVDVRATNGVLANRLQGRAQTAIDVLSRCVLTRGATGHPEFNAPMDVTLNIAVVERRVDRLRVLGAPAWVQACAHLAEPAFSGDLPEADDPEYTITVRASLAPQR